MEHSCGGGWKRSTPCAPDSSGRGASDGGRDFNTPFSPGGGDSERVDLREVEVATAADGASSSLLSSASFSSSSSSIVMFSLVQNSSNE